MSSEGSAAQKQKGKDEDAGQQRAAFIKISETSAAQKGSPSLPRALPTPVKSWLRENTFSLFIVAICAAAILFAILENSLISNFNRQWIIYVSIFAGIGGWLIGNNRTDLQIVLCALGALGAAAAAFNLNYDWKNVSEADVYFNIEFWSQIFLLLIMIPIGGINERAGKYFVAIAWLWPPGCLLYNILSEVHFHNLSSWMGIISFLWGFLWLSSIGTVFSIVFESTETLTVTGSATEPPTPPAPIDNIID